MRFAIVLFVLALAGCEKKNTASDPAPAPRGSAAPAVSLAPVVDTVEIPEVRIRPDAVTKVHVAWSTPRGTRVNEDAPFRVRWNRSDGLVDAPPDVKSTGSAVTDGFFVEVRPMPSAPNATLGGAIDIVVCDAETHSVCVPVHKSLELGFMVVADASPEAEIAIPLPEARSR